MVIGRRKLLRNCSKSNSVLQFREEATSALLSTDSFIWLFHDKVYRQDVNTISLLEYRGYRTFPTIASASGPVKKSSRPIQCMNTNCLKKLESPKQ